MNEMTTTPTTARTDVGGAPEAGARGITAGVVRTLGAGLAVGASTYAVTFLVLGPQTAGLAGRIADLLGFGFQLGLFALLAAVLRTRATGASLAARAVVVVQLGVLGLASLWSVLHAVVPASVQEAAWLVALDMCWPLSMVGMLLIGIMVAVAGRWHGVLRAWPLVAGSWLVVAMGATALVGTAVGAWVGAGHMLLGYGLLGLLLVLRPQLTGAR